MKSQGENAPLPPAWLVVNEGSMEETTLLAALYRYRGELLEYYPRLALPATSPAPLATLLLVWEKWPFATGTCPRCGAVAVATSFGGLLSKGSVGGQCTECTAVVRRIFGGLQTLIEGFRVALDGTSYPIPLRGYPASWGLRGSPRSLIAVLAELGAEELPDPESPIFVA